jgi:hypothetical protein
MGFHFGHRERYQQVEVPSQQALGVSTSARVPKNAQYDAGKAKIVSSHNGDQVASTSSQAGQASSVGNIQMGPVSLNIDLDPLLTGFSYNTHDIHLYDIYRDMYFFDPVPGGITDLYSTLPFSPYTFGGAKDAILEPYYQVNDTLKLESLLPRISIDHLVTGTYVSSIICDIEKREFIDLMAHRMDQMTVTPIPFMSEDPILELNVPQEFNSAFEHKSPRIRRIMERYGAQFINKLKSGLMELDPLTTLYLPRRSFSYEEGTSFFRRILPIWLIEKNLYRGTLIESGRRQRGILQVQMGDGGEWEPSVEEMEFMTDMILAADADPIGSVITTRLGVNMSEFRNGGDLWKVTDIWDQTSQMKMKAMGISESFLSDTTYDNQSTGLNVFMEYMRTYRDQLTRNLFYDKIFTLTSIMNGVTVNRNGKVHVSNQLKGDYHEIKKRLDRDGSRLFIPQVHWSKQMHPEVNQSALDTLRTMQELGIPPSLRAVAAAGGMNLEQLLSDADENIAIERRVMDYKKRMADLRKRYGLGDDDQQQSMSSISSELLNGLGKNGTTAVLGDMKIPSLASRNFNPEIVGRTVTGKKKYIHNQRQANEKANQRIYKAMLELGENRNTPLTSTTVTPFKE